MKEPTTITLKAETAIQQFEFSVTIDPKSLQNGDLPHKLGAKSLIRDLEEGRSYMHKDDKSLIQGKTENDVKNEIIRLSTSYGVISKYTAFIAIEDSDNKEEEKKSSESSSSSESDKSEDEESEDEYEERKQPEKEEKKQEKKESIKEDKKESERSNVSVRKMKSSSSPQKDEKQKSGKFKEKTVQNMSEEQEADVLDDLLSSKLSKKRREGEGYKTNANTTIVIQQTTKQRSCSKQSIFNE